MCYNLSSNIRTDLDQVKNGHFLSDIGKLGIINVINQKLN